MVARSRLIFSVHTPCRKHTLYVVLTREELHVQLLGQEIREFLDLGLTSVCVMGRDCLCQATFVAGGQSDLLWLDQFDLMTAMEEYPDIRQCMEKTAVTHQEVRTMLNSMTNPATFIFGASNNMLIRHSGQHDVNDISKDINYIVASSCSRIRIHEK